MIMEKKFYCFCKGLLPIFFLCCAVLFSTVAFGQYNKKGVAPVQIPSGGFAIDGDAFANKPVNGVGDWFEFGVGDNWLINSDGTYTVPYGDGEMLKMYIDVFKDKDPTAFLSSNKINDNPATYSVGLANVPSKNDMQRAGAYFAFGDPAIGGDADDLWCIFAADRWEVNGESYIDFEFNQARMQLNTDGTITSFAPEFDSDGDKTGGRTPGDVLITVYFERGGKQATLYVDKWEKSGKGGTYLWTRKNVETDFPLNSIFCTENTEITLAPWPVYDSGGNTYKVNQFAEGAINLTQVMAVGDTKCGHLSTVWIRTKTSQSSTAELKDLAGPPFQVDLGIPELTVECPADPNLPACTPLADIQTAFAAWKAGFKYYGGVDPVEEDWTGFPTLPGDVDCKGANLSWTYKVKDYCQQTAECTATFIVAPDVLPPVLPKLPEGGDLGCNPIPPICVTGLVAIDNCDGEVPVTCEAGAITGDDCAKEQIFTYWAVDGCGNKVSEKVTYTWTVDLEKPVAVDCPEKRDLGCNPKEGEWAPGMVEWKDNCGVATSGVKAGIPKADEEGCGWSVTHIHWAEDFCKNYEECLEVITWTVDLEKPVAVDCPEERDLGCNPAEGTWAPGEVEWKDNCGIFDSGVIAGIPVEEGKGCGWKVTHVHWAVDYCGNKAECLEVITWKQDEEAPVMTTCREEAVELGCNPDPERYKPSLSLDDFTDNCGINSAGIIEGTPVADEEGCGWSVTHIYWAEDYCENYTECKEVFTWTVDLEKPVAVDCPEKRDLGCNPKEGEWAPGMVEWKDNCGVATSGVKVGIPKADEDGCGWSVTHTHWAEDFCKNYEECLEVITWKVDLLGPVMDPIEDLVFECEEPIVIPVPVFNDNCDGPILEYDCEVVGYPDADCATFEFPEGETTVCFTAKDECGNTTVECIKITVEPCIINCETAFAFGDYCFLDEGFNRWGWGIKVAPEAVITQPIYQSNPYCDGKEENLVGEASITYSGNILTVHYSIMAGYSMDEVHVYVGCKKYPTLNNGSFTVAPGQFTHNATGLNRAGEYTATFTNVTGDVYVIAHAVVCDIKAKTEGSGTYAKTIDCAVNAASSTSVASNNQGKKKSVSIEGNATDLKVYPNPFSTKVNFEFVAGRDVQARLEIFNSIGQKVTTLIDHAVEAGVLNRVEYQPHNVISGVLFYRLILDDDIINGKLLYNK
jgi:hypothetical protein